MGSVFLWKVLIAPLCLQTYYCFDLLVYLVQWGSIIRLLDTLLSYNLKPNGINDTQFLLGTNNCTAKGHMFNLKTTTTCLAYMYISFVFGYCQVVPKYKIWCGWKTQCFSQIIFMPAVSAVQKKLKASKRREENDSKVHGANMGPIWGRQDPGGPMLSPWTLLSVAPFTNNPSIDK